MQGKESLRTERNDNLLLSQTFPPEITLLRDGEFGTLALRQRDPRLVALTNDENVGYT